MGVILSTIITMNCESELFRLRFSIVVLIWIWNPMGIFMKRITNIGVFLCCPNVTDSVAYLLLLIAILQSVLFGKDAKFVYKGPSLGSTSLSID